MIQWAINQRDIRRIQKKLRRLEKKDAKKIIRQSTRAGAKTLVSPVKAQAPVLTGNLKKGVKVRSMTRSRKGVGTDLVVFKARSDTFYGSFVEYGFNNKRANRKIKGKKFMRKALNAHRRRVMRFTIDEFLGRLRSTIRR